jgi:hypothetical protein
MLHLVSILILLAHFAPADGKRKDFMPKDPDLIDDDDARAHYMMLRQDRVNKFRA